MFIKYLEIHNVILIIIIIIILSIQGSTPLNVQLVISRAAVHVH